MGFLSRFSFRAFFFCGVSEFGRKIPSSGIAFQISDQCSQALPLREPITSREDEAPSSSSYQIWSSQGGHLGLLRVSLEVHLNMHLDLQCSNDFLHSDDVAFHVTG
jgi:hypothetical protein